MPLQSLRLRIGIFALSAVFYVAAFAILSWPWLSGTVSIPWDAKAQFQPELQFLASSLSNSHFGGERDFEGECDLLNRGAFRQCAGRGESDSSSVWERSRTLYRGCGRPVRACRTSGARKTSITSWPISAWRRFHRFSCKARP